MADEPKTRKKVNFGLRPEEGEANIPADESQGRRYYGGGYMQDIPWEQVLANQRPVDPQELFNAVRNFVLETRGGARRNMGGFIQAPTESEQLAEEEKVWEGKFPQDRRARAIAKEQLAFPGGQPSFTQQEDVRRSQTPQQRIASAMGGGWENLDPTQRRTLLQQRTGQVADFVNPMTGLGPTSPQVTAGGPSMINGMPAQQAIAQATQGAERAGAAAQARQARPQSRNPQIYEAISQKGYKESARPKRKTVGPSDQLFSMFR